MTDELRIPIEELERALRPPAGCLSPERIAATVAGELGEAAQAELVAHASRCAACAAEVDLARGFFSAEVDGAAVRETLAALPDSLSRERPLAKVLPMRRRGERTLGRPAVWAAAASLLLAVSLGWVALRDPGGSTLPDRPIEDVVRGGRIEIATPLGVLATLPESISWDAVPRAVRYRVDLLEVDGSSAFETEVARPEWRLGEAAGAALRPFVAYRVRVSALDAGGAELASSEPVELRLEPKR